ncbi:MAG: ATP-binding protein [Trueperaceae bacterium]
MDSKGKGTLQDPRFVDRERELNELRSLAERGGPALALLYGRRRVGKTYLLDHAWAGKRSFYFLAGDTTEEQNKRELLSEITPLLQDPADADPSLFPSWRHVFRLFADLASNEPFVVILDEFQHLLNKEEDIASQLMAVWDREVRGRPLVLIACGSEVATMEELGSGAGPLYGRWTWAARLRPFSYLHAAQMTPERPTREKMLLYGILGGTPRFLAAIRPEDDLAERLVESVLSPHGEVNIQLDRIIEQEKGIRDPAEYRAVLTAIANGTTLLPEIANATGLQDRAHVVRRVVEILENLELVWRERNFDAGKKAPYRHRISDHAVRFWYRFVYPHRSRLETGDPKEVWMHHVQPHLDDYMGKAFESICREAYRHHHFRWGLPDFQQWARWEGRDRNRRSIELDLVARLDDDRILTGEFKWSSKPIGAEVHGKLLRNLEDLGRSGQAWAQEALPGTRSAGHLYVSAAGFTPELQQLARADPNIRLLNLDDLYE